MSLSEAKRLYSQGQEKLTAGDLQGAIAEFQQALQFHPTDDTYVGLGKSLQKLEKHQEAIQHYQKAVEINPSCYWAHNGIGEASSELGRYEEALNAHEKAIQINSNLPDAHCGIGWAFLKLQQYEKAFEVYTEAIGINPNFPRAHNGIGISLGRLGKNEEAIEYYRKAIEIDHSYHGAHFNLGQTFLILEQNEKSLEAAKAAIKINPKNPDTYVLLGKAFLALEQYEKAIEAYQEAARINPDLSDAHYLLGNSFYTLEKYCEALIHYRKSIKIQPDYYYAYTGLGNVLLSLRDFGEALVNYDKAIAMYPKYYNPWYQKGWIIWQLRGFEKAIIFCDNSILKLRNKGAEFREALGYLYLRKGEICHQAGKFQYNRFTYFLTKSVNSYQAAIGIFEQISAREPCLEALQNVVKVLLSLNRVEEADELLRKGTDYLHRWLDETSSPTQRKNLALKFAGFNQLTVDRHIQAASQLEDKEAIQAKLKDALETAETGKNTCLSWLLYALSDEVTRPRYEKMQQLLSPGTAIAYWHLSPAALTTFVLKPGESAPILITQPSTGDRPPSLQQLLKLEAWMKDWDDQYSDYRNKGKEHRAANHSWRKDMAQRLFERQEEPGNLKEILNIEAIEQHLDGISHLILIPHRDLHRFPLHALFRDRLTVSYLPSLQVGLNLKGRQPSNNNYLLSIENPASDRGDPLGFARVESQIISQTFQKVNFIQEAEATQEAVMNALTEGYSILHFSGHGSHYPEKPQKSELLLAGTDGLTLQEICQSDLTGYDLVSLSACETGLTAHQSITTEYVGLVSGFLYSGVAQVISTLWVVESEVSALVMIEFYRRRSGKPAGMALAEAIQWLKGLTRTSFETWYKERLSELPSDLLRERRLKIKRTLDQALARWDTIEPDIQNPYFWASFTLSGGFLS